MSVAFVGPDLARWDQLAEAAGGPPDLLVLPFFSDERPLRGAAGTADWRMCGRLSRVLATGRVSGGFGEVTLLPGGKLPFPRLLMLGLGPSVRFDEARFREAVGIQMSAVARLRVRRYAQSLPGRATGGMPARRALELFVASAEREHDVWVIESPAGQKEMAEVLGRRRPRESGPA